MYETIIILDSKGKQGQLTARKARNNNVYCIVKPYSTSTKELNLCKGIILTGEGETPKVNVPILDLRNKQVDADEIKDFIFNVCKCKGDFTIEEFVNSSVEMYREKLKGKKVLCALSGGVDSSVCAALLNKAIGKDLTCVFVDTGLMRKNEGAEVKKIFTELFDVDLKYIEAEDRFLKKLKGVTDPETKRKIIGEEFIRVFEEEGKKIGKVDYLVQGTIYPDVIESGLDGASNVKSHHNVGGLPSVIDFKELVEPLRFLFKDEVRRAGVALGLPEVLAYRQPFPGPGLAVRCMGELKKDRLDTLREADAIFREEIANAGLDKSINQFFAVYTKEQSVGVKNGARVYGGTIALRAVETTDFMEAEVSEIPYSVLKKVSQRITSEVEGINRVLYDITPKPPATIEWE